MAKKRIMGESDAQEQLGGIDEAKQELLGGGVDSKSRHGGAAKAPKRESRVRARKKYSYRVQVLRYWCICIFVLICHIDRHRHPR